MMDQLPLLPLLEASTGELDDVENIFLSKYHRPPKYFIKVPGRVNLIGEHIDYCGFAVLPMAIEQSVLMAVSPNEKKSLNLKNFDNHQYEDLSLSMDMVNICPNCHHWYHYFICGLQGIAGSFPISAKGMDVAVKGTIPPSSGLSSSSALVCAAAFATLVANGVRLPLKLTMATLCAKFERLVGTEGGGMDQAIAFLAEKGSAKLIEFGPVQATKVQLPKDVTFVIGNCCVPMQKAATSEFNTRVTECTLAAKVLAKARQLDLDSVKRLSDVSKLLNLSLSEMSSLVKEVLHYEPYTRAEVLEILDITEEAFNYLLSRRTSDVQEFKLYQRALHVYEEAARVWEFKSICDSQPNDAIQKLGRLMNESHASCRDLYECSHPDLDELVEASLAAGAVGSRLTGAGWGGCCVSLVNVKDAEDFIQEVRRTFYSKNNTRIAAKGTAIFITKPSRGAVAFSNGI